MMPDRNETDAHALDYVVNDELLLPIPKAFTQALAYYTLLEMLDVFCVQ
jgi:hypothetical protein